MTRDDYPSESSVRLEIIETGRRMYEKNLISATAGNISGRISENVFLITGSGVSKGFLTDDLLITIDIDGNILSGTSDASSETQMHLAIYRQSPEIMSVCHAHPPGASTFAAAGEPLDKHFLYESVQTLGDIPIVDGLPGSVELANNVAEFCPDYNGVLLKHHGAVTWGKSVMQALYQMETLEHVALVAIYSKMMGFSQTLDDSQIEEQI